MDAPDPMEERTSCVIVIESGSSDYKENAPLPFTPSKRLQKLYDTKVRPFSAILPISGNWMP